MAQPAGQTRSEHVGLGAGAAISAAPVRACTAQGACAGATSWGASRFTTSSPSAASSAA